MLSSFSTSFQISSVFRKVIASLGNYSQLTYTLIGESNNAVLSDSSNPFPVEFQGEVEGLINGLNPTSFVNKNVSFYFKAYNFVDINTPQPLFYFGTNISSSNTSKLTIFKINTEGTLYKIVAGSNGETHINADTPLLSGKDKNLHAFVRINSNNELQLNMYTSFGVPIYNSDIITIDSSTFGNDFNCWSLNHDADSLTVNQSRRVKTFEAGKWDKWISDLEMADHLTLFNDKDTYGSLIFYTFELPTVSDQSGFNYHPIVYTGITTVKARYGDYSLAGDGGNITTSSTYVDIPFTIPIPNGVSISMWIYHQPQLNSKQTFLFDAGNNYYIKRNGPMFAFEWGGNNLLQWSSDENKWYHLVITISDTNHCKFYINKVFKYGYTSLGYVLSEIVRPRLGGAKSSGNTHQGFIDNFRLYNSVIDATKINDLFNELSPI